KPCPYRLRMSPDSSRAPRRLFRPKLGLCMSAGGCGAGCEDQRQDLMAFGFGNAQPPAKNAGRVGQPPALNGAPAVLILFLAALAAVVAFFADLLILVGEFLQFIVGEMLDID